MREAVILEIGQTKVAEHWDKTLLELAGEPVLQIFEKLGINRVDAIYAGNMLSGSSSSQLHLGAYISDWVGALNAEAVHVESACCSGAAAFRSAMMAVASGEVNTAIAVGVEKMTDSPSAEITENLATAIDAENEQDFGLSLLSLNAMLMRRYMMEYHWNHEDFANFSINAHKNAVWNPNAQFRKAITKETYNRASLVSDPITVMDAAPIGDGAAAVLIVPLEMVQGVAGVVRIIGAGAATDTVSLQNRKNPLWLSAVEKSAKMAYQQAGITPDQIDLFEAHDAFSIMTALGLEASGFAEQGKGPQLALDEEIFIQGKLPISTRGGLKARGHPIGATGLYQIVEVVQQFRGECEKDQVEDLHIAMTQNIGGSGSNVYTHLFKKV